MTRRRPGAWVTAGALLALAASALAMEVPARGWGAWMGLLAGTLSYALMAITLLQSIRRPVLERLFGPLDRVYRVHRLLGTATLAGLGVHLLGTDPHRTGSQVWLGAGVGVGVTPFVSALRTAASDPDGDRLDEPTIDAAIRRQPPGTEWFLCGPSGLTSLVMHRLRAAGVPRDHVHREFFDWRSPRPRPGLALRSARGAPA